ncbi:hypothetical protein SH2C18_12510 [Clostridium sediminicola]|uniref:hypothetical protein n=1 Tax=Clostridium sediminicola TaxID=3114879 RepID=UPI0031F2302D
MKKNKTNIDNKIDKYFDEEIYCKLEEDFRDIQLSFDLENRILNNTIDKKPSFLQKIKNVFEKEIEISGPIIGISMLAITIILVNPFIITENMKKTSGFMVTSKTRVISLDGSGYIFLDDSFKGGAFVESKN